MFLPKGSHSNPPYQAVVYFPGSNDLYKRSYDELQLRAVEFVVRSGRALI